MKKLIFPVIVLLFAVIISILFLILTAEKNPFISNNNKNSDSNNLNDDSIDAGETQEEINNRDSNPSLDEGSSEGGGGGGGASSGTSASNSTSTPYCPPVSYALRNFIKNSECFSSSNGICTNKDVHCSVSVENLDQTTGQFTIEISLYDSQTSSIIQQFQISKMVSPSQQIIFDKSLTFQSQSEDGDANKDYDCSFKTLEIPKKS